MAGRLTIALLREACCLSASAFAAWACWHVALWMAGAGARGLEMAALVFASAFSLDAGAARLFPRVFRKSTPAGGATTGALLAAAGAAALLHAMHERVSAPSNVADIVLAGLVLGIPAGAACVAARREAKKIVDTLVTGE